MIRISNIALSIGLLCSPVCKGMDQKNEQYSSLVDEMKEAREAIIIFKYNPTVEDMKRVEQLKNRKREIQEKLGIDKRRPACFKVDSMNERIRDCHEKIKNVTTDENDLSYLNTHSCRKFFLDHQRARLAHWEGKKNKYEARLEEQPSNQGHEAPIVPIEKGKKPAVKMPVFRSLDRSIEFNAMQKLIMTSGAIHTAPIVPKALVVNELIKKSSIGKYMLFEDAIGKWIVDENGFNTGLETEAIERMIEHNALNETQIENNIIFVKRN